MSAEVVHDETGSRYILESQGQEVVLKYTRPDGNTIDMQSTFTPPALRGRGLARVVVERALDDAAAAGLKVIPTCSYVSKIVAERAGG